jgi:hypothetical protein
MPTPVKKQSWITNSDIKDRQRFQVVKRTPRADVKGIKVNGKAYKFGQGNMFTVDDPGLAREIHDNHGQGGDGDVLVVPTERKPQPGRRRTWTVPALPWHKDK